ncbi:PucR family transcriptional regulator [Arthrobacter sp. I2-34]|uniref:PucR family transcriptional regulator n=1 Tax=Arthrobacter hankyongi TaxID=2904801 RepID=A0ABS9LAN9_9MICC|nr:PucR family transcriptional regulator [Arthrobacter hankyongi]MCG2623753.1 PucR family transcriptional regulator [Arthrobacter hankyongi]
MIVADLLAEDALQLRLHTPSSRRRLERRISWCAPTEVMDPTPLLSRNVLLLTNGIGMNIDDDLTWHAYVERLASIPVSAIAFGTGTAHRLLPGGLVKAATALDVPLLEIPRAVSFLQVHRHVTNVLQAERYAARTRSWELAETCSRYAAAGSSVRTMLAEVSKTVGGPAAIIDGGGAVIACWPASSRWAGEDLRRAAVDDEDERGVPLPMGGDSFQLVVRGGVRDEPLTTLLAPAASIMAVQLRSALQSTSHKQPQFRALLAQVADWEGVALQEFTRTFRSTGLDPDQPTYAIAALAAGDTTSVWKIRLMLQEAFDVLRMMIYGDVAFALAQRPAGDGPDSVERLETVLSARLRALVPHQAVVLKGPCGSVDELRLGLYDAAERVHKVSGPVVAAELSIGSLLAAAAGHGARTGAHKLLAPVLAYDDKHSAHLLQTLTAYLENDCQPSRACRKLFIHRNTLAQRLRKLESLLALSLDTLEGQTTCLLALRIRESQEQPATLSAPSEARSGV